MASAESIVREFWRLMGTNDFSLVSQLLAAKFVLEWPQSNERIRGAERFIRMNSEYPANGPWRFTIERMVASASEVVTQVAVTDGTQSAVAITFFQISDFKIQRLVEYWPESFVPPGNRAHLTEPLNP